MTPLTYYRVRCAFLEAQLVALENQIAAEHAKSALAAVMTAAKLDPTATYTFDEVTHTMRQENR